jgi:hypothetical protein
MTTAIHAMFAAICMAAAVLFVVCHLRPRLAAPYVSMPYVFQWRWNVGVRAFDMQTAIYAVFHRNLLDDLLHHLLTLDQICWAILAYAAGGVPALGVLATVVIIQAVTFGERGLVAMLAVAWVIFGAAAMAVHAELGESAGTLAMAVLLASPLLRVLGHAAEPQPPLIGDNQSLRFTRFRWHPKLIPTGPIAWVAEFASGLPFRLFASQMHLMAQRFGFRPRRTISLEDARKLARQLAAGGWESWALTREMFAWHPSASARDPGK